MTINDVLFMKSNIYTDNRGEFRKSFNNLQLEPQIDFRLAESFYSISKPGVFRGMHLQTQKSASFRSISLVTGQVIDVLIDLRSDSETFLKVQHFNWDSTGDISSILVPPGVAHGFLAIQKAILFYASDKPHDPEHDTGVNPMTIDLPFLSDIQEISERDLALPSISSWTLGDITV